MQKLKQQTFNDGIVNIYTAGNTANDGDMPKEGLTIKESGLRYEERTVGMTRFWAAAQANVKIDLILRTPLIREISTQDIAIPIDGKQYSIEQVQYPKDVTPPSMDLSLQRLEQEYETN